jgi:hypothetical protein
MGLALLMAGAVLLIAAVRDRQGDLFSLVEGDLTGPNNFFQWALAIVIIGAIGYVPKLKPLSTGLLALVLISIFLRRGTGFFTQLAAVNDATQSTQGNIHG